MSISFPILLSLSLSLYLIFLLCWRLIDIVGKGDEFRATSNPTTNMLVTFISKFLDLWVRTP